MRQPRGKRKTQWVEVFYPASGTNRVSGCKCDTRAQICMEATKKNRILQMVDSKRLANAILRTPDFGLA